MVTRRETPPRDRRTRMPVGWVATTDLEGADVRLLRTAERSTLASERIADGSAGVEPRGPGNGDHGCRRRIRVPLPLLTPIAVRGAGYFPAPSPEGHRVAYAVPLLNRILAIDVAGRPDESLFSWTGGTPLDISWQRVLPPSGFADVGRGHTFESEVAWLAAEGITNGCSSLRARHLLPGGVGHPGPRSPPSWLGPSPTWNLRHRTASPMMTNPSMSKRSMG